MRVGSLFTGIGTLDLAVCAVLDAEVAWHVESDAAASRVLAARFPGIPNHGDITTIDWTAVEPVDVLCGGWPCQPFSFAGQRKGTADERHMWPHVVDALAQLQPSMLFGENVPGHLAIGFDHVLRDLRWLGYTVRWLLLKASDVGAPHRRERLFLIGERHGSRLRSRDFGRRGLHHDQPSSDIGSLPAASGCGDDRQGATDSARLEGPVRRERESDPAGTGPLAGGLVLEGVQPAGRAVPPGGPAVGQDQADPGEGRVDLHGSARVEAGGQWAGGVGQRSPSGGCVGAEGDSGGEQKGTGREGDTGLGRGAGGGEVGDAAAVAAAGWRRDEGELPEARGDAEREGVSPPRPTDAYGGGGGGGGVAADAEGQRGAVLETRDGGEPAVVGAVAGAGVGVGAGDPAEGVPHRRGGPGRQPRSAADPSDDGRERGVQPDGRAGRPRQRPSRRDDVDGRGAAAADAAREGSQGRRVIEPAPGPGDGGGDAAADPDIAGSQGPQPASGRVLPAGSGRDAAADPAGVRRDRRGDRLGGGRQPGVGVEERDPAGNRGAPSSADPEGVGRPEGEPEPHGRRAGTGDQDAVADTDVEAGRGTGSAGEAVHEPEPLLRSGRRDLVDWGRFEPAIRQWEAITGYPVPPPTGTGTRSLNPDFVEWMMAVPPQWTAGISRSARLRCLGNAVVPPQAVMAFQQLVMSLSLDIGTPSAEEG